MPFQSSEAFSVGVFLKKDDRESQVVLKEFEDALVDGPDVFGYCFKMYVEDHNSLRVSYDVEAPEGIVFNQNGDVLERTPYPGREWFAYWMDEVYENRFGGEA